MRVISWLVGWLVDADGTAHSEGLSATTNPYEAELDGVLMMGNGGQVVASLLCYMRDTTPLDALAHCIEWRHTAPTAPDTLACYPFEKRDAFVLAKSPHVMFVGNQSTYESEVRDGVRLLRVPSFATTGTAVLLNLATLETSPVSFAIEL